MSAALNIAILAILAFHPVTIEGRILMAYATMVFAFVAALGQSLAIFAATH